MNRRSFLQSVAGLSLSSTVLADQFRFTPLQTTPTKPTDKPAEPVSEIVTAYRLDAYTASWCGPCQQWKATQKQLVDANVSLIDWDGVTRTVQQSSGIKTLPTFRLKLFHDGKWKSISRGNSTSNRIDRTSVIQWTGYQTAETINREIERQQRIRSSTAEAKPIVRLRSHRKTIEELRHWIHANYTANTATLHADVSPRSFVWKHLTQTHGFTASQINGLSQWEALALHSGAHRGTIS